MADRLTCKKRFEFYHPDEEVAALDITANTYIAENNRYYLVGEAVDKLAKYEDEEKQA